MLRIPLTNPAAPSWLTLRPLRSRSCGAYGPARWPTLRSSHPEGAAHPRLPVPLRGAGHRAFGSGSEEAWGST
ncbi:hypothetical protein STENM223S_09450 [Streptomyces tendae]